MQAALVADMIWDAQLEPAHTRTKTPNRVYPVAISPSSAVHGGQYDTRVNMWHSSSYCMRHSCRTQFGTISLNQLVELACCRRASTTARHSAISHARSSEARTCRSECDNGSKQTALVTARMLSSISSSLCFRNQRRYRKLSGQKMKLY